MYDVRMFKLLISCAVLPLIVEAHINLSSNKKSNSDVENLFDDMKDLIDSVKKYD